MTHAKAVFFVDDQQAQLLEAHVFGEQAMCADGDVYLAAGEIGDLLFEHLFGAETAEQGDPDGIVGQAFPEDAVVLFGKQRGGN